MLMCIQNLVKLCPLVLKILSGNQILTSIKGRNSVANLEKTRTVRGSDYSPAIELSEQKDKLVTATGDTETYSEKQANKVWLNSVYWFSRY